MEFSNGRVRTCRRSSHEETHRSAIEGLEPRRLLSISPASLTGPINDTGTTWTYQITNADDGQTASYVETVVGPATFNGMAVTEVDTNLPSGAYAKSYNGYDASGDYVGYGETSHTTFNDSNTVQQPYVVIYPAVMEAGVPYRRSYTQVDTDPATGVVTTTPRSTTLTLLSETTTPLTVPSGTYDVYQVQEVDVQGAGTSTDGSTTDSSQSTTTVYASPYVGIIQVVGANATEVLTKFNDQSDHLAFDQPPTTTASGKPIDPAVTVSARDAANNVDTSATGSITLTLASASRLGTSPGTLGGTATEPLVNGVATFSDLTVSADGTYQLTATDSDTSIDAVPSGKFRIGTSDLKVEITTKLASKSKGGSLAKGAQPGDRILYSVLVTPKKPVDTANVVLSLPSGFVPAGITAGGVFAGNTITWTANTRLYDFDVTVPSATALAGLKQVVTSVDDNVTYTDSDTDEATTTNVVKLASSDDHLKITRQPPASVDAMAPFPVTVALVDAHGKLVTDENSAGVQLSLNDVGGGTGATLLGGTTATFVNGVATFAAAAGPAVRGVGKFTLTAIETTTDPAAATPADTRPFQVQGYKLKLAGHNRRPLTAATDDVDLNTTLYRQTLAVVDAKGRPVTSLVNLPDVEPSAEGISGTGTLAGGAAGLSRSPIGFLSDATADQDFSIAPDQGTTQTNYPFAFTFTSAGTYKVTYAAVAPTDGTDMPASLVQPLTIRYTAVNPAARVLTSESASANEKVKFQFGLVRLRTDPLSNIDNNLQPANASVGVLMQLTHASTDGGLSGTPSASFDAAPAHLTRSDGSSVSYTYSEAVVSVSFEKPGLYTLRFTEAVTPGDQPFDPNNASAVATTASVTVTYRVLPDRLVVTQPAPDAVAAGQPFSLTVQVQDSDGNLLTDQSAAGDEVLVARVSATSVHGQDTLADSAPVAFAGGVATFTLLVLPASGIYRISVAAFDQLVNGNLNPTALSIRSGLTRVTAGG